MPTHTAPQAACIGQEHVYDDLIDHDGGEDRLATLRAARDICGRCPLMATCLRDHRAEPWAQAILGLEPRRTQMTKWAAKVADRRADIEHLLAAGAGVDEVCERLGVTHKALNKWCTRNAPELWFRISPPVPEAVIVKADSRRPYRKVPFDVPPEARAAHSRYVRGFRDEATMLGEREYQRSRRNRNSHPKPGLPGDGEAVA